MNREVAGSIPAVSAKAARREPKLYIVVRSDIGHGLATAQAIHAAVEWTVAHGRPPANVVVLAVTDETDLLGIAESAEDASVLFREPDIGNEATAVAIGPLGWKRLSSLPLLR